MLKKISIKSLYTLALSEGEGVGTAYEYFAKRLVLSPWIEKGNLPNSILVAGLPQKYGASMDFLLMASELNAAVTVIDDRQQALDRCQEALEQIKSSKLMSNLEPTYCLVNDLSRPEELVQHFDLALSCEVMQRLESEARIIYLNNIFNLASSAALFTPNGDNPDHNNHSGLSGISLEQLQELPKNISDQNNPDLLRLQQTSGYIDMPPFPPGMTRSDDQRQQATSGKMEAFAMWGLQVYAQMESWLPTGWRKKKSHIVYSFLSQDHR